MNEYKRAQDGATSRNFVPALQEVPRIVEVEVVRELPAAPQTILMPTANYTDRARGFSLATAPLAGVVGLVAGLVAISAFSVPFLSVAALLVALGGFALTWLAAFIAHTFISPDGSLFLHTVFLWGYLRREQAERIRRYRSSSSFSAPLAAASPAARRTAGAMMADKRGKKGGVS